MSENYRSREGFNRFHVVASVDPFCIDKSSSSEFSEVINSMFQWYQRANVYFAYIIDVDMTKDTAQEDFNASRWWTRGWTLQELLAPFRVIFYDTKWRQIETKKDLAGRISSITAIDSDTLKGVVNIT
jgi:hypothetical protein